MKRFTIEEFMKQEHSKDMLRLLTAGSVDDGKSTLIGRLLYDSKRIYEDQLQALARDSQRIGSAGGNIDYALLCDGLKAEREQGITIDVAYRYFATSRRKFIIADTPGHEQYTRNMVTGGSTADLAIILVDATQGIVTQTRRHTLLISLLGIRHIVLAVNKMDMVGYSQSVFNTIAHSYAHMLDTLNIKPDTLQCIPLSALMGDNVVRTSTNMPWYNGAPLLTYLEGVQCCRNIALAPFRFYVQYVIRPHQHFRGFAGKITSGSIHIGDTITALPSGVTTKIKSIAICDSMHPYAFAPQSVTLILENQIDLSRGDMLYRNTQPRPQVGHKITAMLVWMDEQPLDKSKHFYLKHATHTTRAQITDINYRIDINSGEHIPSDTLSLNEIVQANLVTVSAVICDPYSENRGTGSFILIDPLTNFTSAAGMVLSIDNSSQLTSRPLTLSLTQCGIDLAHRHSIEQICKHITESTGIVINCTE